MKILRLLTTALFASSLPLALAGQAPASGPPAVDTLLVAAGIPNVLGGVGGVVQAQLTRMSAGLPPEQQLRVGDVTARHFRAEALYGAVASSLSSASASARIDEIYGWLTTGPVAEARRLAGAYRPPLPLDEFTSALTDLPPPQSRVLLMLRLARAQGAGPLYLTLAESIRGAAHMALGAVSSAAPPFRGLSDDQVALALETHDQQSVLLFLHRYATIPDDLLASWSERYESDSGQWYVAALSRAVRDALLSAAEGAAAELRREAEPAA